MREYLRKLRQDAKLSQKEMSSKLDISESYYSLIESGERRKKMDIDLLSKLSDALHIPIADLIEMERRNTDGEDNDTCGDGECVPGAVPEMRRPAI